MKHHVGNIIKQKLDETGISYASVAVKINKTRSTISHLLQNQTWYVDAIYDLSIAVGYNFLKFLSDDIDYQIDKTKTGTVAEPLPDYMKLDYKNKYNALAEECKIVRQDRDKLQIIANDRAHIIELLQDKIKQLEQPKS